MKYLNERTPSVGFIKYNYSETSWLNFENENQIKIYYLR